MEFYDILVNISKYIGIYFKLGVPLTTFHFQAEIGNSISWRSLTTFSAWIFITQSETIYPHIV